MDKTQESRNHPDNSETCTQNEKQIAGETNCEELNVLEGGVSPQNEIDRKELQDKKSEGQEDKEEEEEEAVKSFQSLCLENNPKETPEEKALRNPLVVKSILSNLKCSSLLQCRLINKLWLSLSTELLQKSRDEDEDALRIKFHYCEELDTYMKFCDEILFDKVETLVSFNDFLTLDFADQSTRSTCGFPCKNFEFKGLDLTHFEIIQFFKLYGCEITGLRLGFSQKNVEAASQETLVDLLMNKAKNVETLTFLSVSHVFNLTPRRPRHPQRNSRIPNLILPQLRCCRMFFSILFDGPIRSIEEEIILAAPGLKEIHVTTLSPTCFIKDPNFDYLTSISKGHLIKRIHLKPTRSNLSVLTQLAQSRLPPRVTHLTLSLKYIDNYEWTRQRDYSMPFEHFLPFALALLESSKDCIQHFYMLRGKCVSRLLKVEEFPPLEKVREVGLGVCCSEESRSRTGIPFPIHAFNRIFPNAWKLSLTGETGTETRNFLTPASPTSNATTFENENEFGVIPQIKSLELVGSFTRTFWELFPYIFCNVENLVVKNENLLPVLPKIWISSLKGLPLKVLEVQIPVDYGSVGLDGAAAAALEDQNPNPSPTLIFPGLDAAITGLPQDSCAEIHAIYPTLLGQQVVQRRRINKSILDLKHLEELYIKFQLTLAFELPLNILTVVSGAYAFQQMKSELGLNKVQIVTEIPPQKHGEEISTVISRRQQAEDILKPLEPFADVTFKLGPFYSGFEINPVERNFAF